MTSTKNKGGLSAAAIAGIALGCAVPILALVIVLFLVRQIIIPLKG